MALSASVGQSERRIVRDGIIFGGIGIGLEPHYPFDALFGIRPSDRAALKRV